VRRVEFSSVARRQLARVAKKRPELLSAVFESVADLRLDPFGGLNKPEPLRGSYQGYWSIRLNKKDRLVYTVADDSILIFSVEGHYDDH
jgi:toxin YoeB